MNPLRHPSCVSLVAKFLSLPERERREMLEIQAGERRYCRIALGEDVHSKSEQTQHNLHWLARSRKGTSEVSDAAHMQVLRQRQAEAERVIDSLR